VSCTLPKPPAKGKSNVKVDPIQHAWKCCNPDTTLPTVLVKGVAPSPLAYSLSSVGAILRVLPSIDIAKREAHSRVVGKRANALSLRRWTNPEEKASA
jgi:hypothetical protein